MWRFRQFFHFNLMSHRPHDWFWLLFRCFVIMAFFNDNKRNSLNICIKISCYIIKYLCNRCRKSFKTKWCLRNHLNIIHECINNSCNMCDFKFTIKYHVSLSSIITYISIMCKFYCKVLLPFIQGCTAFGMLDPSTLTNGIYCEAAITFLTWMYSIWHARP